MSIEPAIIGKAIAKTVTTGLSLTSDAVAPSGNRLSRFIQAYAPESVVGWFEGRRLRIRRIKVQEQLFDEMCISIVASYKKRFQKIANSTKRLQNPLLQVAVEEMSADLRMLDTIRVAVALSLVPKAAIPAIGLDSPEPESIDTDNDISWWDTFETFARRRNEPWRIELLARAIGENDLEPGSISLKSLWEIGMMEKADFDCLSTFCDSALYVDGKALVLIEPQVQVKYEFELGDGKRVVNLAYAVSALEDAGLIVRSQTQFDTTDLVQLDHMSCKTIFIHTPPERRPGEKSAIRVDAFSAGDIAMDICRLYSPKFNEASEANFALFKELMESEAKEAPQDMGSVRFTN